HREPDARAHAPHRCRLAPLEPLEHQPRRRQRPGHGQRHRASAPGWGSHRDGRGRVPVPGGMRLRESFSTRTATLTERGVRPVNQDAVLSARLPDGSEIIAVADGMGGQAAGEVASRLALGILETALRNGEPLDAAVQAANTAVFEEARVHADYAGMGTTIVAVHRYGDEYMVANVGDSRAYRIDDSGIRQLTLDHSFVAEARRAGAL